MPAGVRLGDIAFANIGQDRLGAALGRWPVSADAAREQVERRPFGHPHTGRFVDDAAGAVGKANGAVVGAALEPAGKASRRCLAALDDRGDVGVLQQAKTHVEPQPAAKPAGPA